MDTQLGTLQRCAQVLTRSWLFMKKSTLFLRGIVWVVPYGIGISPLSLAKTHAALLLCEGCRFSCSWRSWHSWRSRITSHKSSVFPSGPSSLRWHRGTGTREWKRKKYGKKEGKFFRLYGSYSANPEQPQRDSQRHSQRDSQRHSRDPIFKGKGGMDPFPLWRAKSEKIIEKLFSNELIDKIAINAHDIVVLRNFLVSRVVPPQSHCYWMYQEMEAIESGKRNEKFSIQTLKKSKKQKPTMNSKKKKII